MATMPITGVIIGTRMRQKVCQALLPSMSAASIISSGMPWKAATNIIVGMPTHCHTDTSETQLSAVPRSPSQGFTRKPSPMSFRVLPAQTGFIISLNR